TGKKQGCCCYGDCCNTARHSTANGNTASAAFGPRATAQSCCGRLAPAHSLAEATALLTGACCARTPTQQESSTPSQPPTRIVKDSTIIGMLPPQVGLAPSLTSER